MWDMWNLKKKDTNELICKTNRLIDVENLGLAKGKGGGGIN